jgi:uncharacterized cupin superfamily protein
MPRLSPNTVLNASVLDLEPSPLASSDIVGGSPEAHVSTVVDTPTLSVGVWELTPGTVTDTEIEEVFVVLSGSAVVEFAEDDRILQLSPGTIGRLGAGAQTRWTVTETLRKVYITVPAITA